MRMKRMEGRRYARVVMATACAVVATAVWPAMDADSSVKARAQRWVEAHRANLPASAAELRRYPAAYRDAVYQALEPAAKYDVWRTYLTQTAATAPDLSDRQRGFLRELAGALTPQQFGWAAEYSSTTRALLAEAPAILGATSTLLRPDAWVQGDDGAIPITGYLRLTRLTMTEWILGRSTVAADDGDPDPSLSACNCYQAAQGAYDCPAPPGYLKDCLPNTPSAPYLCQNYDSGCDLFKNHPCNGQCTVFTSGGGGDGGGGGGEDGGGCYYDSSGYCDLSCQSCTGLPGT
jgi:hypothetical protein